MYEAVLKGDWEAVEVLLQRTPSIAHGEITESGDRALHLAAAMGRRKVVQELVERSSSSELALLDGRGCTPCCYAAISGAVEIIDIILKKNPSLIIARDKNNATPLHKAAFCGNRDMVSYLLKFVQVEDLSRQEWFDLLLLALRTKIYGMCACISFSRSSRHTFCVTLQILSLVFIIVYMIKILRSIVLVNKF